MTDLPRPDFTPLPPPPGGSADARRRGRRRRHRQTALGTAVVLAVTGGVLSAAAMSTTSSAVDRLDSTPFATTPGGSGTPQPEPTGSARPDPASPAPTAGASSSPAPQEPAAPETAPPTADAEPSAAPPRTQELVTDPPLLTRHYDPPQSQDTTVCGGRITGGIGTAEARTGWCVMAAVQQAAGGRADLSVRVCRSSEARRADLHVAAGAVTMRLEQGGEVVWRLPEPGTPAEVLSVDPAGCWVWTHGWDGRGADGEPLPDGPTTLHVTSRAAEVEDLEDQEQFTHAPDGGA